MSITLKSRIVVTIILFLVLGAGLLYFKLDLANWEKESVREEDSRSVRTAVRVVSNTHNGAVNTDTKYPYGQDNSVGYLKPEVHATEWRAYLEKRESNQHRRVTLSRIQNVTEDMSLSPWQRARLEGLLMDKEMLRVDMIKAARVTGASTKSKEFDALYYESLRGIDEDIKLLLGEPAYSSLESLASPIANSRLYAVEFLGEAYSKGVALTRVQRETLDTLLSDIENGDVKAHRKSPVDPLTGLSEFDVRVLDESRKFLSNAQVEVLANVRRELNEFARLDSARKLKRQSAIGGK